MSDGGENSGLLDNLRKSVKEQVGSENSRESTPLDILIISFVQCLWYMIQSAYIVCEFYSFPYSEI